jgi:hypothetical protein
MSAQNRTALKALVTAWAATLDLETTHKPTEQHILDSVLLNRDVVSSIASSGTITLDFAGNDVVELTTTNDCTISFTGIETGESKVLIVNKELGNILTFVAVSGIIDDTYVSSSLEYCIFLVTKKGVATPIQTVVTPLFASFDIASIPTPEAPGAWQELFLVSPWIANSIRAMQPGIWYRENRDMVEITICIQRTTITSGNIATLPSGYRPAYPHRFTPVMFGVGDIGCLLISDTGLIYMTSYGGVYPNEICWSGKIPLS